MHPIHLPTGPHPVQGAGGVVGENFYESRYTLFLFYKSTEMTT